MFNTSTDVTFKFQFFIRRLVKLYEIGATILKNNLPYHFLFDRYVYIRGVTPLDVTPSHSYIYRDYLSEFYDLFTSLLKKIVLLIKLKFGSFCLPKSHVYFQLTLSSRSTSLSRLPCCLMLSSCRSRASREPLRCF